jgi:hypothetical protein
MTAFEQIAARSYPARPASRTDTSLPLAALCALGAALAVYGFFYWRGGWVMPLDDAYITLHNAEVLFSGHDASFGASPLTGATSLVHLALTAALLPLCHGATPAVVCLAGAAAYIFGVSRLARALRLRPGAEALLIALALMSGSTAFQLFNGLETSWALAAATWAVALAVPGIPDLRLAALLGTLPFLRPELGLLSLALLGRQVWLRRGGPGVFAGVASDLAVAGLAAAPWLLWSEIATGALIPNTAGAKAAFFADTPHPFVNVIVWAVIAILKGAGPLPLILPLSRRSVMQAALLVVALVLIGAFMWRFPGLLGHNSGRYTMALLPFGLWALASLYESHPQRFWALGGALALLSPLYVASGLTILASGQAQTGDAFVALAWTELHIPSAETLLVHDAGVAGLVSTRPLVDLVGLKSPGSAAAHQRWTLPSQGRERSKAIAQIAAAAHGRFAMILQDEERFWADLGSDLQREGWRLELLREPAAHPGYAIFKLTPPN